MVEHLDRCYRCYRIKRKKREAEHGLEALELLSLHRSIKSIECTGRGKRKVERLGGHPQITVLLSFALV